MAVVEARVGAGEKYQDLNDLPATSLKKELAGKTAGGLIIAVPKHEPIGRVVRPDIFTSFHREALIADTDERVHLIVPIDRVTAVKGREHEDYDPVVDLRLLTDVDVEHNASAARDEYFTERTGQWQTFNLLNVTMMYVPE